MQALFLLALVFIPLAIWIYRQDESSSSFQRVHLIDQESPDSHYFTRKTIRIPSKDPEIFIESWLYIPKNKINPPLILMANGLGLQKDCGLPKIAEEFTKNGYAVMSFDYRHFGGSDGEPRNVINIGKQLDDWLTVYDFITTNHSMSQYFDSSRIATFGFSLSGGHAITVAAKLPMIKAVISNLPFLDGLKHAMLFPKLVIKKPIVHIRFLLLSLKDILRRIIGWTPHYIPIIQRDENGDSILLGKGNHTYLGYMKMFPENPLGGWKNKGPASTALTFVFYRPITYVERIKNPILLICGKRDEQCPIEFCRDVAHLFTQKKKILHILIYSIMMNYLRK